MQPGNIDIESLISIINKSTKKGSGNIPLDSTIIQHDIKLMCYDIFKKNIKNTNFSKKELLEFINEQGKMIYVLRSGTYVGLINKELNETGRQMVVLLLGKYIDVLNEIRLACENSLGSFNVMKFVKTQYKKTFLELQKEMKKQKMSKSRTNKSPDNKNSKRFRFTKKDKSDDEYESDSSYHTSDSEEEYNSNSSSDESSNDSSDDSSDDSSIESIKKSNKRTRKDIESEKSNYTKRQSKMVMNKIGKEAIEQLFRKKSSGDLEDETLKYFTNLDDKDKSTIIKQVDEITNFQTTSKPMVFRIMSLDIPIEQRNQILNDYISVSTSRFENNKLKEWVESVMKIPFGENKGIDLKTINSENVKDFLNKLQTSMDDAAWGHNDAKRQIIQMMGQQIRNPNSKGNILGIYGPPGNGKCFALNTPILMIDGTNKYVQDVQIGDIIMGDDSTPRNVLSLGRGYDNMYYISYVQGGGYTVNSEHILCLMKDNDDTIYEMTVKEYLELPNKDEYYGYRTSVNFSKNENAKTTYEFGLIIYDFKKIPENYLITDTESRYNILAGIIDAYGAYSLSVGGYIINIPVDKMNSFINNKIIYLARSLGLNAYINYDVIEITGKTINEIPTRKKFIETKRIELKQNIVKLKINVKPVEYGEYFGFTLDGNNRFVLGDFTVTHNTSLIKDGIAKAMDKPFVFISLGGASDASFLEGHSFTYEGSIYGRIANGLITSKCMNPILYFDELDKISKTPKGDEIVNLLIHITDPVQNNHFRDKYFHGIDIDLSKATIIFSCNDPYEVNPVLLDRITMVETKYLLTSQKIHIAKNYLLPTIFKEVGFEKDSVIMSDDIIRDIINKYTLEGGVRKLKACLYNIIREINIANLTNVEIGDDKVEFPFTVKSSHISILLKNKREITFDKIPSTPKCGVVNGLYANSLGVGGVLPIEVVWIPSSSPLQLKATGSLEKVIKESTEVACSVAWNHLDDEIKESYLDFWKNKPMGFHIHCPDGATPKDGPSAGAALTLALYSLFTNRKIKNDVAMTGEINLQGNITAIGGLEEKLEGAKRAGAKLVLVPVENEKDLIKIKERNVSLFDENFEVKIVNRIEHVIEASLLPANPFNTPMIKGFSVNTKMDVLELE